jgi:pseudaminic acid synthase
MVKSVREAEMAVGKVDYSLTPKQKKGKEFCRSLYVVNDVKKGDLINKDNVRSIRPGFGLHPKYLNEIVNKKFKFKKEKGDRLSLNDIEF